jgi:hypothetical protein
MSSLPQSRIVVGLRARVAMRPACLGGAGRTSGPDPDRPLIFPYYYWVEVAVKSGAPLGASRPPSGSSVTATV